MTGQCIYVVMKILTLLYISLVIVLGVNAKNLDPQPKAVKNSTSQFASVASSESNTSPVALQKNKKRHATREVILYLTPSQIKALEAGEAEVSFQSLPEPSDQEELTNRHLKLQEQTEFVKQEFENLKSASIQQIEPQNYENSELLSQEPFLQKELLIPENQQEFEEQLRQELAHQEELKLRKYYYELNRAKHLKFQQEVDGERNAWFAYSPNIQINEEYQVQEPLQEDQIENKNQLQLKALSSISLKNENSESFLSPVAKPILQLQYFPKYNDQEKAIEIEKILRTYHRQDLEKQSALTQAEKIANSPAILVHEQVKVTKQRPVPVVKHVKVPVPTPELVSVSEPVPVNVPHPYVIPQEIIKRIPVPIVELERPEPYKEERQYSVPFNKILVMYVDRPHVDQKIEPVEVKAWS